MRCLNRKLLPIALAISGIALTGCSGKEGRQAKYLERSQNYLQEENYEKARIEAKNVLQINANNAEARYIFAEIAEHEMNWQEMYSNLSAAIEGDPKQVKARVKLAQLMVLSDRLDEADEQAQKINEFAPNSADYYAVMAAIATRRQKPDDAEKSALKALEIQPEHIAASALLSSIYASSNPDKAEKILADAIQKHPREDDLRVLQINVLIKANKDDSVIAAMKELIARHPDKLGFVLQLANYYLSTNRPSDADKLFQEAIKKHPDNTEIKLASVEFAAKQSRDNAVSMLSKYVQLEPDNYRLRSTLARLYAASREMDKAVATYQHTIDKDVHGDGIDARNRVIEIRLAEGNRPMAENLLRDVLKLEPENADALLIRAKLALVDNKADAAIVDLRSILKNSSDSTQALMLLATAQERQENTALALDSYKKILEKSPKYVPALIGAARLELTANNLDKAQKSLEQTLTFDPDNQEASRLLVELYSKKQQWPQALEICERLILKNSSSPLGVYLKGLIQFHKNEFATALQSFKNAAQKEPRAIEPLRMIVATYGQLKQNDTAVSYLENYIKTNPENTDAHQMLGVAYRRSGKFAQAQQAFEYLVKQKPASSLAYRELVALYSQPPQPHRIETLLHDGLEKNPGNVELLMLQAQYYQSVDNDKQALESYEKALALQPKQNLIKNNLAVLLMEKFPTEENLRRSQSLSADFIDSSNPAFVDTLAWVQYKMHNYGQSISLLEKVLKEDVSAPELRYHLGMAYLKNGMPEKAKRELSQAVSANTPFRGRDEAESELRKIL